MGPDAVVVGCVEAGAGVDVGATDGEVVSAISLLAPLHADATSRIATMLEGMGFTGVLFSSVVPEGEGSMRHAAAPPAGAFRTGWAGSTVVWR